jgi:pantoate--beta-alanine ligase
MKLIRQINDLNKAIRYNHELGFVPTMGGLHKGHESLIKISKKKCKKTLVSIFINPKQFNNNLDFKKYPRNINRDLKILKKLKVDFVFLPTVSLIYKKKKSEKFKLKKSQKILCAKLRKGHFEGVLDVMNRFIGLILPKYVFMGEKDFQQFFLVKNFIEKKYKTKIHQCKTIRDINKVALSSRNFLLHKDKLKHASIISKKMIKLKRKINRNKGKANNLIKNFKEEILKKINFKIEYLEVRNSINLGKNIQNKNFKLFIAYYLDKVRLIDNF